MTDSFVLQVERTIVSLKTEQEEAAAELVRVETRLREAYDLLRRLKMPLPATNGNGKKRKAATHEDYVAAIAMLREQDKQTFTRAELAEIVGVNPGAAGQKLRETEYPLPGVEATETRGVYRLV